MKKSTRKTEPDAINKTALDYSDPEFVQVIGITEIDMDELDRRNGWVEPGAPLESAIGSQEREELGIVSLLAWQLSPASHIEKYFGPGEILPRVRTITLSMETGTLAKTVCLQMCIRPAALGLSKPSLEALAQWCHIKKQVLGRVMLDLRRQFPGFFARCMRSEAVRAIYAESQKCRADDQISNPQTYMF
jgi:hypothetical protein